MIGNHLVHDIGQARHLVDYRHSAPTGAPAGATYEAAGVSIEAGDKAVLDSRSNTPAVLPGPAPPLLNKFGSFAEVIHAPVARLREVDGVGEASINQIKLLRTHIDMVNGRDRIAVATDSDPAGWKSAQKAFWHLTAAELH